MNNSSDTSPEIDKESLYGNFLEHERARLKSERKLQSKAQHMALDVAFEDDDTKIDVKKDITNHNGVGAKGITAIALAAAIPALGGLYMAYEAMKKPPKVIEKTVPGDSKTEYVKVPGKTTVREKTVEVDVIPPGKQP